MDWKQKRQKQLMKWVCPKLQDQLAVAKKISEGKKIVDGGYDQTPSHNLFVQCEGLTKNKKRCQQHGRWTSKRCISHRNSPHFASVSKCAVCDLLVSNEDFIVHLNCCKYCFENK